MKTDDVRKMSMFMKGWLYKKPLNYDLTFIILQLSIGQSWKQERWKHVPPI